MHLEFARAEYLQKRKHRLQWVHTAGILVIVGIQLIVVLGLLYVTYLQ